MNNLFKSVPCFRNETNEEIYDCRENCFLKLYCNSSLNECEQFETKLIENGFEIITKNKLYGNSFTSLKKDDVQVTVYFTPCDSCSRVTVGKNQIFPCFEQKEIKNACKTTFFCFENDHSLIDCGMCLMFQCSDYSFFVVDSGHYFQFNDNDRIYKFMRDRTPKEKKVVVNGWLITHAHTDHICKFMDFLRYNCYDVEIEGIYSNLLPADYSDVWDKEEIILAKKLFKQMENSGIPNIKIHSGQRFYIRNLTFDVIYTHEDSYPKKITDYNDSSCAVIVTAENTRIFIPGDSSEIASEIIEKRYGKNLSCDVVQVAHHGHSGLSEHCYELINADLAIFPITRIKFDEEYPRQSANRKLIELANKYYISSDGTICVPLPYSRETVYTLPDETFEDFAKIYHQWGYDYTPERKKELYDIFLKNGGNLDQTVIPDDYIGFSLL